MTETATRKGMATSEFLGLLLTFAMILADGTPLIEIPSEYIMLFGGMATAYGGGRTLLKNTMAKGANP